MGPVESKGSLKKEERGRRGQSEEDGTMEEGDKEV